MSTPIGFAVLATSDSNSFLVNHVNLYGGVTSISGVWEVEQQSTEDLAACIGHRLVYASITASNLIAELELGLITIDLSDFVSVASSAQARLQEVWSAYRDAEKSRIKLVSPNWPEWPVDLNFFSPISALETLGKSPYSRETPDGSREVIAMTRLVRLLADFWLQQESERQARPYLLGDEIAFQVYPASWLSKYSAKAV